MDAFDFDNVKAEKAKAMLRYNCLRTIAKLFRLFEICLALVILSWISARLPFAVRISREYSRRLITVVVSPIFIFLVSNAIVITLLAKSGQLSGKNPAVNTSGADIYEELLQDGGDEISNGLEDPATLVDPEEIVYEDKQMVSQVTSTVTGNEAAIAAARIPDAKTLRRSQSENLKTDCLEKPCAKLRRSETEKCHKIDDSDEIPQGKANLVEELSTEEFQRTIEEFIAKQLKFHHEEKFVLVTCSKN